MKKLVLLFTGMLMGLTPVTATEKHSEIKNTDLDFTSRYRYAQPIMFVERGVEFLIFADGSFDFNTELFSTIPDDNIYYYKNSNTKRRNANRTFGAPGTVYSHRDRGVIVRHDRMGRVRRIGNVFINYDRQGRIKRAGSVYMSYRRNFLRQVGGLQIQYNRYGEVVGTRGFVNYSNQHCGICQMANCTANHFNLDTHYMDRDNRRFNDNDDYYYYKSNGKVKKQKKIKKNKKS